MQTAPDRQSLVPNPAPQWLKPDKPGQRWWYSYSTDPNARIVADRHYSRKKPGTVRFVQPGRCLVLKTRDTDAVWVTSWPFAEYVLHRWGGAWLCSMFRNESDHLSSELILEAVAATRAVWGVPDLGMITFIDTTKVRRKRDWGRCYRKAGFKPVGHTQGGLVALQLLPYEMPPALEANGFKFLF